MSGPRFGPSEVNIEFRSTKPSYFISIFTNKFTLSSSQVVSLLMVVSWNDHPTALGDSKYKILAALFQEYIFSNKVVPSGFGWKGPCSVKKPPIALQPGPP